MIIESRGFVVAVNSPLTGWYRVALSHAPQIEVSGVSLKNTAFTAGQQVIVFQYGLWGKQINEFGFTELPGNMNQESLRGQLQIVPSAFDYMANNAPAQVAASYIARAAGNNYERYFPCVVTAVGVSTLTVRSYDGTFARALPVASDLTITDFSVNDAVLIQTDFQGHPVIVLGWWLTVPESGLANYIVYNDYDVSRRILKEFSANNEWIITGDCYHFLFENSIPYSITVEYVTDQKIRITKRNLFSSTTSATIDYEATTTGTLIWANRKFVVNDYINGLWVQISGGGTMPADDRYFLLRLAKDFSSVEKKNCDSALNSDADFLGCFLNKNCLVTDSFDVCYTVDQNYDLVTTHDLTGYLPVGCGASDSAWGYSKSGSTLNVFNSVEAVEYSYDLGTSATDIYPSQSNEKESNLIFFENTSDPTTEISLVLFNKITKTFSRETQITLNNVNEFQTASYLTIKEIGGDI